MEKIRISRKETKRFWKNVTNQYLRGDISHDEYMGIEVEFAPLDLSAFPAVTKETERMLNILFTEETENREGEYMLCSRSYHPIYEMTALHCHFENGDDIHCWASNDEEMLIYEYCEHDVYCTMYHNKEAYQTGKAEMIRWWREAC